MLHPHAMPSRSTLTQCPSRSTLTQRPHAMERANICGPCGMKGCGMKGEEACERTRLVTGWGAFGRGEQALDRSEHQFRVRLIWQWCSLSDLRFGMGTWLAFPWALPQDAPAQEQPSGSHHQLL